MVEKGSKFVLEWVAFLLLRLLCCFECFGNLSDVI